MGDIFSDKSIWRGCEPAAELQARMLRLESCHHPHGVLHKLALPLLLELGEPIALPVALQLPLPLFRVPSLVADLSLPLNLSFLG